MALGRVRVGLTPWGGRAIVFVSLGGAGSTGRESGNELVTEKTGTGRLDKRSGFGKILAPR